MNREQFYTLMSGEGTLDYELYLNTKKLLSSQTKLGNRNWKAEARNMEVCAGL